MLVGGNFPGKILNLNQCFFLHFFWLLLVSSYKINEIDFFSILDDDDDNDDDDNDFFFWLTMFQIANQIKLY